MMIHFFLFIAQQGFFLQRLSEWIGLSPTELLLNMIIDKLIGETKTFSILSDSIHGNHAVSLHCSGL